MLKSSVGMGKISFMGVLDNGKPKLFILKHTMLYVWVIEVIVVQPLSHAWLFVTP